jgi:hypothetical protein
VSRSEIASRPSLLSNIQSRWKVPEHDMKVWSGRESDTERDTLEHAAPGYSPLQGSSRQLSNFGA